MYSYVGLDRLHVYVKGLLCISYASQEKTRLPFRKRKGKPLCLSTVKYNKKQMETNKSLIVIVQKDINTKDQCSRDSRRVISSFSRWHVGYFHMRGSTSTSMFVLRRKHTILSISSQISVRKIPEMNNPEARVKE